MQKKVGKTIRNAAKTVKFPKKVKNYYYGYFIIFYYHYYCFVVIPASMALIVEGSELYCCKTEIHRNSVVVQASRRMGWALLELQAETGIEKRTIQ